MRITSAAKHLLNLLEREGEVVYSRFYDGSEETETRLASVLSVDSKYTPVAVLFDLAVFHLKHKGLVEKTDLETHLADGEFDYKITLTPKGRRFLREGGQVVCPDTVL